MAAFTDKVRRDWPRRDGDRPRVVEIREVRPFQSYGNRLRRWIDGRGMDTDEISVDMSVGGVPFEVRVIRRDDRGWRVRYFQSHAG